MAPSKSLKRRSRYLRAGSARTTSVKPPPPRAPRWPASLRSPASSGAPVACYALRTASLTAASRLFNTQGSGDAAASATSPCPASSHREQAELVLTLLIDMDYFMFREGEEKHLMTARRSRPGEQEHAYVVAFAICCCYSMLEAPARSTEEQDLIRELEPCRAWGLSSSREEDGEGAQLLMGSLPSEEDGGGVPAAAGAGDLLLLGRRGEAGRGCRPQQQKIDREGGVVAGPSSSRSIEMEMWSPDCPPDRSRGSCSWNRSRWTEEEDRRVIRIF